MKQIWAPWRSKFIYQRKRKGCIFCQCQEKKSHSKNFVIETSRHSFSIMNIYPYNNGHVMVVPRLHKPSLEKLSADELMDLMSMLNRTTALIKKVLKPHGMNIGINIGKISGAGYPGHVHVHIVPRWQGDTNFMPVFTDTKVISESLETLYKSLKHASCKEKK
jgi:ATP adenylyltransferase